MADLIEKLDYMYDHNMISPAEYGRRLDEILKEGE